MKAQAGIHVNAAVTSRCGNICYMFARILMITTALSWTAAVAMDISLEPVAKLQTHYCKAESTTYKGKQSVRVTETGVEGLPDGSQFAAIPGTQFADGVVEVDVAGRNGRIDDQVMRNHSVQYMSHPEWGWAKLREQFQWKYESYVDLVPGEWVHLRIEVKGETAKLFVRNMEQPVLIVKDLKRGRSKGAIGLWVGPKTVAHFVNLKVETK